MKFYATVQLWSSVGAKIKQSVNDKQIQVGVVCRVRIRKNRITGKERQVEFPIYYDTGIDDIGSMIDYMVAWGHWKKKTGGVIDASSDFNNIMLKRESLIEWIEENKMREDLEDVVEAAWNGVETKLAVKRENKYGD